MSGRSYLPNVARFPLSTLVATALGKSFCLSLVAKHIWCKLSYFLEDISITHIRVVLYFHRLNLVLLGKLPRSTDGPLCWDSGLSNSTGKAPLQKKGWKKEMRISSGHEPLGMDRHGQEAGNINWSGWWNREKSAMDQVRRWY